MSDPASRPETDDANGSRTHRDPAIEAAQRAINGPINGPVGAFALAAAREALKPVREWFENLRNRHDTMGDIYLDEWSDGIRFARDEMLKEIAPLIYTAEEMP